MTTPLVDINYREEKGTQSACDRLDRSSSVPVCLLLYMAIAVQLVLFSPESLYLCESMEQEDS